ncbi:hypothetical protein [Mycobacterium marseillense]|nr:hypothetical protein [Mycobacterium marseillense]
MAEQRYQAVMAVINDGLSMASGDAAIGAGSGVGTIHHYVSPVGF